MSDAIDLTGNNLYPYGDEGDTFKLIDAVRRGISFSKFTNIAKISSFSLADWSKFLHLTERTFQRYKKEKKKFSPLHSEKILEISLVYNKGTEVFGNKENFDLWLESKNIALGGIKPKDLLDSSFGIGLLRDELGRIEHGIFA